MTKFALACALLVAVSSLVHAQEAGLQFRAQGSRPGEGPFTISRQSDPRNAPNGNSIRVSVSESGTSYPDTSKAAVHIGIEVFRDKPDFSINDIRDVRILDTQGRPVGIRDNDPRDVVQMRGSTSLRYSVTYELLKPSEVRAMGKVAFTYQGKEYDFDMKAPPSRVKQ